jgi:tetratricopeptide (TPR) repeat protein
VCRLERPLYTLGWWSEKVALFDSALGIPGPITKMRARAHAFRSRAGPLHLLDPNHAALAESMASELGEVLLAAYARSLRAIWLWWSGDFERSIELSGSAAARFEAAGRTLEWSEARKFLGVAMVFAGETAGGLEIQQSTLATVRRTGAPFHVAHHLAYLGHCRRMLGDDAAALADLTEALEICRDVGNRGTAIHLCITLGELAVERGDAPGALALTAEALELIEAARGWTYEPWAWTVALRAHAHLGDLDAALTCGRRALARLARVPSGEGTRLAGELADVALRRGEPETAVRLMRVARESDDVRELPFRPRREVERFEDLDGRICAALGERPHGPPTGDQLSIAEAAGRLLIGPP